MAETTLVLNGFSIIGDPQTNSNASGGGALMIHDGTAVFDANDIVVYAVSGATENGVLTDESAIIRITVYDNASDYINGVAKYEYEAPPGSGAAIDVGRDTMGDRYLEFDATSLLSSDPDAPVLGDMTVVAGVNILGTLEATNGPFVVPTNADIHLGGDGTISGTEISDGLVSSSLNLFVEDNIVCGGLGTLIKTPWEGLIHQPRAA